LEEIEVLEVKPFSHHVPTFHEKIDEGILDGWNVGVAFGTHFKISQQTFKPEDLVEYFVNGISTEQ
jgi:hypothetical protein